MIIVIFINRWSCSFSDAFNPYNVLFDQVCKCFYVLCCRWSATPQPPPPPPPLPRWQVSQRRITINKQRDSFRAQYVFPVFFLHFADRTSQYIYLNINQLGALKFYNEFISRLYMFRARDHRQEAKIVLYSLCYHHTYRWPSHAQVERGLDHLCTGRPPTGAMIPEAL